MDAADAMNGLEAADILETVRSPLLVLDPDLRVTYANRAFHRTFHVGKDETLGRLVSDLGDGQWDIAQLRELLHEIIPTNSVVEDFDVETVFPRIGHRVMRLNARKVYRKGNHTLRTLLSFEDITDRVQRNRDRDEASKEIYHRVKNSLQVIMSFISHEVRHGSSGPETLKAIQSRIAAVAELYDLMSRSEAQEAVAGNTYLTKIAANLSDSLLGAQSSISIKVDAEPLSINKDYAVSIGLCVNELATNAVKHAFPEGEGVILIGLQKQGDAIRLSVSDNGIGLSGSAGTTGSGFGSRYVNLFVRQLDGNLNQSSSAAGSTFDIRLPLSVLSG